MLLNFDLAQIAEDYVSEFVTHVGKALKVETERGQKETTLFWNIGNTGRKKKVEQRLC